MNAASDFIQAERILRIDGLLGGDELLAETLVFREAISELFTGEMQLRSKTDDLAPDQIIGKTCDISLELGEGQRRIWNVLVTNMAVGPKVARGLQSYRLTLRPSMWLLSQRSDCRIWQDMTSIEVCETLMSEHGLPSPALRGIIEPPEKFHYAVQHNETDLDYLTRRLESDGIFYYFTHEAGQHVLTLSSHAAGYIGGEDVRFAHGSTDLNHINRFETSFSYTPGQRTARDWNFQTPGHVPEGGTPSLVKLPKNGSYELFEYPMVGGYGTGKASDAIDNASVEKQSKLRMQASEADHRRVDGASNTRTLAAGARFTPYDVANPSNTFDPHVILAIEHRATDASYETGGGQPDYQNRFLALPADVPATPHRATPRPRIDGTQVAIVAGPPGEEIHPDEYGRIKLWFPWDRRAKKDGSDTCWVRVTQNWAGAGWGGQVIPRIGMEVMVTYLDGDPDRPVVTGVVPNAKQKVPYKLPQHKTKSVFRTNTHKDQGFNELSFEDATGAENIALHAQKDQTLKVLNNRMKRVDNDQVESVGSNKSIEIGNNHQERVGGSMNLTVGGGKMALFASLAGIAGQATTDAMNVAKEAGDPLIPTFLGGVVAATVGGEVASGPRISAFDGAGQNALMAGADQIAAGSALGGLLSSVMPVSGVKNTIVEKFQSDTIGLARTEQIGLFKNTMVGGVQNTLVGRKQFTKIGEEQRLKVGKTKTTEVGDEYTIHTGRRVAHSSGNLFQISSEEKFEGTSKVWEIKADDTILLSAPGGYIEITKSGVKIRGLKVEVEGNAIDFRSGGSGEGSKCLRAMAASATPFVR